MMPSRRYGYPVTKRRTGIRRVSSTRHSMRSVVGLRLPVTSGIQGLGLRPSKKCKRWTGMNASRASVASGSWVMKKSEQSTTTYSASSTNALASARRCFLNRHQIRRQLEAPETRSSAVTGTSGASALISSLFEPDPRIEPRQEDVRDQGADDREEAIDEENAPGQVHVLVDQRPEQERADVGEVHHGRHDQAPREEGGEVPAYRAHQRIQRQPRRVADDQAPLGQPLRARGGDVRLVELVEQIRAHHAGEPRGPGHAKHVWLPAVVLEQVEHARRTPRRV